jgi:hypothetical protein
MLVLLQVRVAIAAQLHVMAKEVPPSDAARLLRRPLSALLRDTSPLVREALLAGLADTLQVRIPHAARSLCTTCSTWRGSGRLSTRRRHAVWVGVWY